MRTPVAISQNGASLVCAEYDSCVRGVGGGQGSRRSRGLERSNIENEEQIKIDQYINCYFSFFLSVNFRYSSTDEQVGMRKYLHGFIDEMFLPPQIGTSSLQGEEVRR